MSADAPFRILIAGLGLMGGSMAQALAGFRHAEIYAVDRNEAVLRQAEAEGVIRKGFVDGTEIAPLCDLVIVCLFPAAAVAFINTMPFRDGAVVTDVCGVKGVVYEGLTRRVRFVGGHPMAGRESGGYANASAEIFLGATYLVTPPPDDPEAVALVREMAYYIGCKDVVETTPEEHDRMVSFTSQLMHVVAYALCDDPQYAAYARYGAGSLRDCTRVAESNPRMWSELFLDNRRALTESIALFEERLRVFRETIAHGGSAELNALLQGASEQRRLHRQTDDNRLSPHGESGRREERE